MSWQYQKRHALMYGGRSKFAFTSYVRFNLYNAIEAYSRSKYVRLDKYRDILEDPKASVPKARLDERDELSWAVSTILSPEEQALFRAWEQCGLVVSRAARAIGIPVSSAMTKMEVIRNKLKTTLLNRE